MIDAAAFAREWQAGWNSHDLERILHHYRDDIVFRSRKAVALTGAGEVVGIEALRAYWSKALASQPDLRFSVERIFAGHDMVTILYRNHKNVSATETLYFDLAGKVFQAAACHEVTDSRDA